MNKLRGTVVRETEKAIYFHVEEDLLLHLEGQRCWFPKSKTRLPRHLYRDSISIYVPDWLYDSNVTIPEHTR